MHSAAGARKGVGDELADEPRVAGGGLRDAISDQGRKRVERWVKRRRRERRREGGNLCFLPIFRVNRIFTDRLSRLTTRPANGLGGIDSDFEPATPGTHTALNVSGTVAGILAHNPRIQHRLVLSYEKVRVSCFFLWPLDARYGGHSDSAVVVPHLQSSVVLGCGCDYKQSSMT